MNRFLTLGFAAVAVLAARTATAQEFGKAGGFIIAADRVVGFTSTKTKAEGDVQVGNVSTRYESETSSTQFDFLVKGSAADPFVAPRLAFDYFVIDGLSLGGAIGYSSGSFDGDETINNNNRDLDEVDTSLFVVSPRVGYAAMFTPVVGIWPRGGFTYWSATQDTNRPGNQADSKFEASGLAFTAEFMLVIAPVEHGAFLVGPTVDFPLTGSAKDENGNATTDLDELKIRTIGLQASVGVWF